MSADDTTDASPAETREGREALVPDTAVEAAVKAVWRADPPAWTRAGMRIALEAAAPVIIAAASPAAVPLPEETGGMPDCANCGHAALLHDTEDAECRQCGDDYEPTGGWEPKP